MNDYLDYLAHYRTPGSINGVSHTPGYDAVGKRAMTEAERKAARADRREKRRNRFVDKTMAKANNERSIGRERKATRTLKRGLWKHGMPGSANDVFSGGKSTSLYNRIRSENGQAYADQINRGVRNRAIAQMVTGATVAVGAAVAAHYIQKKG